MLELRSATATSTAIVLVCKAKTVFGSRGTIGLFLLDANLYGVLADGTRFPNG